MRLCGGAALVCALAGDALAADRAGADAPTSEAGSSAEPADVPGPRGSTVRPGQGPSVGVQRPPADLDLLVGFRGVGEVWQDVHVIDHYRSSRFAGTGFMSYGVLPRAAVEVELGYMRMSSESGRAGVADGALEVLPVAISACLRSAGPRAELFIGGGPALAVFNERTVVGTVSGAKPGVDFRTGVRLHTRFVEPSMRPNVAPGLQGMDLELMLGRRQHHAFGYGTGFDFSAWRIGLGLVARL